MDDLHSYDESGLERTMNGYGYMHRPSKLIDKFVQLAKKSKGTFLDIGCAYGVATIPCLQVGAKVTACDIDARHLEILQRRTPRKFLNNLKICNHRFPDETNFCQDVFNGILISHVLSFLLPEEIEEGLLKAFRYLKVNGKIFVINYTPYHETLKNFIPVYEKRKRNNETWPGLIKNKEQYSNSKFLKNNLPKNFILFDIDTLSKLFNKAGFIIDECNYSGSFNEMIPEPFKFDGREWVCLIATKKI